METIIVEALPVCGKCHREFDSQVNQGSVAKSLLSWLPIKRYFCSCCSKNYYKISFRATQHKVAYNYARVRAQNNLSPLVKPYNNPYQR